MAVLSDVSQTEDFRGRLPCRLLAGDGTITSDAGSRVGVLALGVLFDLAEIGDRPLEAVGEVLELEHGADAGEQLEAVDRLADEIVGAGVDARSISPNSFKAVTMMTGTSLV
jgi:hypothetical protein